MGKINDESIDTVDKASEDKFLHERQEIISGYMHELAMKSVKLQKKLYGKKKFSEMGKASVIVRRAKREENMRKKLDEAGEAVDFQLK